MHQWIVLHHPDIFRTITSGGNARLIMRGRDGGRTAYRVAVV